MFVGIWESAETIASQIVAMISNLNEVRDLLEELSQELVVTDPVSGNIVSLLKGVYNLFNFLKNGFS
tara:strand:+ start:264 stop:464 length:201 start_codon:yes stop_codon:yes gene_type:complete